MFRTLHLIVLVLLSLSVQSQVEYTGTVVDELSGLPLPYANVGIQNTQSGTVSDEKGRFILQHTSNSDSLVISYIGYQPLAVALQTVEQNPTLYLSPQEQQLTDVTITSKSYAKEVLLGVRNVRGRGTSIAIGNPQLGTEIAAHIKVSRETLIDSVHFVLNHAKGDSLLMRLNIYDMSTGSVGKRILTSDVIIQERQRKGIFSFDLTPYSLIAQNDVLVAVEWLRDFSGRTSADITFDTKKTRKGSGTYVRFAKTDTFRKMSHQRKKTVCIYLHGRQ